MILLHKLYLSEGKEGAWRKGWMDNVEEKR